MGNNILESKILWSQIDGNMHLRHSAYADFGAQARLEIMENIGLDLKAFEDLKIGPILFREELIYFKEVKLNETIKIITYVTKLRKDFSRFSFRHEVYKADGVKCAVINIDGAWLDLVKRKLTVLPQEITDKFANLPKSDDFQLEEFKKDI